MRWKKVVAGLALSVAGVIGCKQTCYLQECDYEHYKTTLPAMTHGVNRTGARGVLA